MAIGSSLSAHPNPNANHHLVYHILQPYLEQGRFQSVQSPYDGAVNDAVPDDDDSTTGNKNSTISNPIPSPIKFHHISFNQEYDSFAARTESGFRTFNTDPFRQIFCRDIDVEDAGVGAVEMLHRSNLLALVGASDSPEFTSKVMIWDDRQLRVIGEIYYNFEVLGVRLRKDRIIVVLEKKIFVHNFVDLKLLHSIATIDNPKGLCAVSQGAESFVLVCPGRQKGQIRVKHYASPPKRTISIMASGITCFTLTQDGNLLAAASSNGQLVRIYDTRNGSFLQEVHMGAESAESVVFSRTAQWLAVLSDKGTIHSLEVNSGNVGTERSSTSAVDSNSSLSFNKGERLSSKWSMGQFRLREGCQYIVGFGREENTVVILGVDGSYYRCKFDPAATGGEITKLEHHNFLKP